MAGNIIESGGGGGGGAGHALGGGERNGPRPSVYIDVLTAICEGLQVYYCFTILFYYFFTAALLLYCCFTIAFLLLSY
jgi:hypothetical protein